MKLLSHVQLFVTARLHEEPTRLLSPWNFPGKNIGVGYHFLLQGVFLTQGSNPSPLLQHWKVNSLPLRHLLYHSLFLSNMVLILAISKLIPNILITFLDNTTVK